MKIKVTLKDYCNPTMPRRAPEIFETYSYTIQEALEQYCYQNHIDKSEVLEFRPLVVSKDGPGLCSEGYHEQRDDYHDKPASAFKAHSVHPKQLVNSLWRDSNNRYLNHIYKITEVRGEQGTPINPFDLSAWEIEYVELNPRTMQIVKGDLFGIVSPTYKHMNLARFMKENYCFKL